MLSESELSDGTTSDDGAFSVSVAIDGDGADASLIKKRRSGNKQQQQQQQQQQQTFYKKHIDPHLEKGFVSNVLTFLLMILGRALLFLWPTSIICQFVYQFGLFGFAGGFTNWLAIKMLFDRVPGLYGSGVIPRRFKEIRETVKNTIMATFFDNTYLKRYLNEKAGQLIGKANLEEKINQMLNSPQVDEIIERKLGELATRPEGMFLVMMGMNPSTLKPLVKPFVTGMGSEFVPFLTKNFDVTSFVSIDTIRTEIDNLMTTKLQELTPEKVRELMDHVMRAHLGWLIVWGNVFGGLIGWITLVVNMIHW